MAVALARACRFRPWLHQVLFFSRYEKTLSWECLSSPPITSSCQFSKAIFIPNSGKMIFWPDTGRLLTSSARECSQDRSREDDFSGDGALSNEASNAGFCHRSSSGHAGSTVELANVKADQRQACMMLLSVDDEKEDVALRLAAVLKKLEITEIVDVVDYKVLAGCSEAELFEKMSFLIRIGVLGKQLVDLTSLHPSLLTLNLVNGLNSVLECMVSFGLEKSVLGELLALEPGLAQLLTERALENKIQALQDRNFSRDSIAAFLKCLSRKQLAQFLRLPVEKIDSVLTFVTELGLKNDQAIKLVESSPTILFRNIQQDFESKMKVLESVVRDSKKIKKIFAHIPDLLGRKNEGIEETVLYLKSMVKDAKELERLIETNPIVLSHSKRAMHKVSEYLQSIGFASNRAAALMAAQPYLISCEVKRLQKHVDFLKSKDLDEQAICTLMENSTDMFFRSLEKRVAGKIEFFENQGITGERLQKFFKSRPQICRMSLRNSMAPNLKFLLDLGFPENSATLRGALKVTLPHSCKSMQGRVDHLVSLGIEPEKVYKIVRAVPSVLVMKESGIKKRIEYLIKTMKRPLQELVMCPSFLNSNLESTIKPRVRVLEWLRSQGLGKDLPLSTIVETAEESFVKQFVEPFPQVSSVYRGSSKRGIS